MNCPKCSGRLAPVQAGEVEIERCVSCQGLWFDHGEDTTLRALHGSDAHDVGNPDLGELHDKVRRLECPRCHVPMHGQVDRERPELHFESCPSCGGVYLDAGELREAMGLSLADVLRTQRGSRP